MPGACGQPDAYVVASRTPCQLTTGCGGCQRSSPVGGAANGSPRKAYVPSTDRPRTIPLFVATTGSVLEATTGPESAVAAPATVSPPAPMARAAARAANTTRARRGRTVLIVRCTSCWRVIHYRPHSPARDRASPQGKSLVSGDRLDLVLPVGRPVRARVVLLQRYLTGTPGGQHRLDDLPAALGDVAAHREQRIAAEDAAQYLAVRENRRRRQRGVEEHLTHRVRAVDAEGRDRERQLARVQTDAQGLAVPAAVEAGRQVPQRLEPDHDLLARDPERLARPQR